MKTLSLTAFCLLTLFTSVLHAQPRQIDMSSAPKTVKPAPESFGAKYEGGMFGFNKNEDGTLKFDDANARLVFFDEDKKEMFSIPYASMLIVSPQSKSVQSTTGTVVRAIPLPGAGILGGFIKEKRRYLVISFDDPDVDAKGLVNFRLENLETLDSVIAALAQKAALKQRGDAYYRPRAVNAGPDK